jgi:lipopolysaccharide assembly protein A
MLGVHKAILQTPSAPLIFNVRLCNTLNQKSTEKAMRYIYILLIILITLAVVTFKVQNIESVTVSFLSSTVKMPLSVLILGVYFLGLLTGGMVVSAVRSWIRGATRPLPSKDGQRE